MARAFAEIAFTASVRSVQDHYDVTQVRERLLSDDIDRRLKIWGEARIVAIADDPGLVERLFPVGYAAVPDRASPVAVKALDWNCAQHIPERLTRAEWDALD